MSQSWSAARVHPCALKRSYSWLLDDSRAEITRGSREKPREITSRDAITEGMVRGLWLILVVCGGCVFGGGPVVGYGTQRGVYAGVAGVAGVNAVHATAELGGTKRGAMGQGRLDVELNRARFMGSGVEIGRPYPGLHMGIGYVRTDGAGGLAAVVGPDVAFMRNKSYCEGAPAIYVGVEWRYIRGESQIVVAPRYETLSDICLR